MVVGLVGLVGLVGGGWWWRWLLLVAVGVGVGVDGGNITGETEVVQRLLQEAGALPGNHPSPFQFEGQSLAVHISLSLFQLLNVNQRTNQVTIVLRCLGLTATLAY